MRVFLDGDRSDNRMQSEVACHVGVKGNCKCRRCDKGGTSTEKESDAGYHKLFFVHFYPDPFHSGNYYQKHVQVGNPRSSAKSLQI